MDCGANLGATLSIEENAVGFAGLSIGHILVVLLVVILVFGTKKLGNIGSDLGAAIKGFRKAMASPDDAADDAASPTTPPPHQPAAPHAAPASRAEADSSPPPAAPK